MLLSFSLTDGAVKCFLSHLRPTSTRACWRLLRNLQQTSLKRSFNKWIQSPGGQVTCNQRLSNDIKRRLNKSLGKSHSRKPERRCQNRFNCLSFLGVGGGSLGYVWLKRGVNVAECKQKLSKNRLIGVKKTDDVSEPKFDWREFFRILSPDIWYLLAAVLGAFAVALVNIKIPLMLGGIVDVVATFTRENAGNFIDSIKIPASKLLSLYGIQGFLTFCYISLLATVGENTAARLKTKLFESLLKQDVEFFDRHKTGELIDRLTSDIQDFKSSFKLCIAQGLRAFTQIIGCVFTLFLISPKLTSMMVVVVPGLIGVGSLFGSGLRVLSRKAQSQVAVSTAVADEALGNIRTVRAFAMEKKENELYSQEVDRARNLNIRLGLGIGVFQGLSNVVLNGIILATLFIGGYMMSTNELKAGDLMSFLVATQTVERSLAQMSLLFGQVVRGMSAGGRIFEFINSVPSIPLEGGKVIPYHSLFGNIEFKDVTFSYPTRSEQIILSNFNLKIPGGKVVALVGLSGGGKSTVASLLERFYDVQGGDVLIDNINLKDLNPSWLRGKSVGFINQEPVLFATTVMENIRYGQPSATDAEVIEAAKLANAHDFISQFPDSYQTVLGERGVTVSGGQKQRIAIARALIKNPSILILDEATSALDAESERIVQEALDRVTEGRTVLVIAHRLSTIRDADIIAVVSNGSIAEIGTHLSLKKQKGLYWDLIQRQQLDEEIEEMEHRQSRNSFHA